MVRTGVPTTLEVLIKTFFFNVIPKLVTFLKLTGCELAYQSKSEVFAEHPSATMLSVPPQGSATLPWP